MESAVRAALESKYGYCRQSDGLYHMEIYADYRDEMSNKEISTMCTSEDPWLFLWEQLEEWYSETQYMYRQDLEKEIRDILESSDGPYPNGFDQNEEELFEDAICELVCWDYPADHFLRQECCINIMLDTGDGNTDYSLNSPFPCWYGRYKDRLDERSSLLWLARQQGYTKTQLWRALRKGDVSNPKGFLESCRQELANLPSHMATLVFLAKVELRDLIELNRCIRLQDRNGHFYDNRKNPYCGYIVLDKGTMTGLYDPWSGAGSVLELQLEKDVRVPIRFIRSALPDGKDGYSIASVYGMCISAWSNSALKKIHAPNNIEQLETKAG